MYISNHNSDDASDTKKSQNCTAYCLACDELTLITRVSGEYIGFKSEKFK